METGLESKTVVITGASGGIGQALVRAFAAEGARVVIHYFRGQENALQLADEVADSLTVGADLRCETEVCRMFEQIEKQSGAPDILVANAGFWPAPNVPIQEMSLEQWNDTLAANQTSAFLCAREFLACCARQSVEAPSIVLVGSTAGAVGEAGHGDYATAKGGLMSGLLNSLKNEIPRSFPGGRINAVCPGWTLTPMAEKLTTEDGVLERVLQTIALRKVGRPEDVASAVLFLASQRLAGHITGQKLFVSGGMEGRVLYDAHECE
ncbi:MAG: SDR family NAD(P)-dependent oxidoreductase [Planctomycetota bacterium]|nr:SDR family NAD(P)-dependent oxidoreductase [Planctomycetota bacterium]